MPDDAIDTSDIPELNEKFWEHAKVVQPTHKTTVNLQLPEEVVAYFKAEDPKGYIARMAEVLTAYVNAHEQH